MRLFEDLGNPGQGGAGQIRFVDQRQANISPTRVNSLFAFAAHIGSRQNFYTGLSPDTDRRRLSIPDVEPEEEPALWLAKAEPAAQNGLGDLEVPAVERAIFGHMLLVLPESGARRKHGKRNTGAADPQDRRDLLDQRRLSGDQGAAQARRPGPLRQRVEGQNPVQPVSQGIGRFECARRGRVR